MHTIKSAARRQAWYNNDDPENKTYNIFNRTSNRNLRRMNRDEESGPNLTQVASENQLESPTERQRRAEYNENNYPGPKKAGTFPEGPNGDRPKRSAEVIEPYNNSSEEKNKEISNLSGSTQTENDEQIGAADQSATAEDVHDGPRKRKFHIPFTKKEDDAVAANGVQRSGTSESKKNHPKITIGSQLKVVFVSWVNILLVCVPVGIALEFSGVSKVIVFVINFIAIIPLAGMLSYATEELALYVGETLGGLLNASFGNAVELIVSIIALKQGKILIVQTSLIGSMLSNLLLVMGMCFFFGGLRRREQFFNITVAQTAASLLAIAIGALLIPTAFFQFAPPGKTKGVAPVSRGIAVLLLVVYGCYLFFQLKTHITMYQESGKKAEKIPSRRKAEGDAHRGIAAIGAGTAAAAGGHINAETLMKSKQQEDDDEEETPQLTRVGALVTLAGTTVLVALCAEYMVSSINAISKSVSQEFIGLILLPIVGNAAEHATAVTVAIKDKMDLAIGVAIGSSLQIALLVLPLMVIIGWCGLGQSHIDPSTGGPSLLTLNFDGFQIVVLVVAIWLVNYVVSDGKSHWLEGVLLQVLYLCIAVAAWFYPASGDVAG